MADGENVVGVLQSYGRHEIVNDSHLRTVIVEIKE